MRDVELGRLLRRVRIDRRVAVGAAERPRERVVVGRAVGDEAEGGVQQLRRRVVVEVVGRLDPLQEAVIRGVLGLGVRVRAAVVLGRRRGARALVVERPLLGEVAVGVDAVAGVAVDAVVVVVAQRLAPQAVGVRRARGAQRDGRARAAGERVVVAVRVEDGEDPDLGGLEQLRDARVVLVREEPLRLAARDLGGDPLARVVDGAEEHRRARAVGDVAGVVGDLQREDRLAEQRRADLDELGDVLVGGRLSAQLVGDAAGLGVAAEDVVVRVRAVAAGGDHARLVQLLGGQRDALGLQRGGLAGGDGDLELLLAEDVGLEAGVVELDARIGDDPRLGAA